MLKPDKIYKYIAYTFWEHFFFLIAVQNTVQVPQKIHHDPPTPQLDKLPAAVWAVRICEWEHSSASKNAKMSSFFFFLIRWPLSVTFLHSMFCSVSIQRFSELGFLTSLQMKISTASVSRSSRPLKGFNFLGAVLSTGEGGKKRVNTKHFMTKTVENVLNTVQWLKVNSIFPQAHRILSMDLTDLHFSSPDYAHSTRPTLWTMACTDVIQSANLGVVWLINKSHEFVLQNYLAAWDVRLCRITLFSWKLTNKTNKHLWWVTHHYWVLSCW